MKQKSSKKVCGEGGSDNFIKMIRNRTFVNFKHLNECILLQHMHYYDKSSIQKRGE